ncbi:MAG: ssDNA-binding Zn-finger/Zn-ribbon topoisomerase 1 [Nonlabens sp.]|jgi:ssDNA-binding Zn-finger/Zn-ribbon topoisomerase 1|uniref:hypothetical protein n=1 Tax=Nonlabens sp. TaxID=1888209 RepID=UPI0039E6A0E0
MLNNIDCPNCLIPIAVNTEEFLKGVTFPCSNCDVKLGLEEKTDLGQEQLELFKKFTKLKKQKTTLIPCPDCGTAISFLPKDLKTRTSIACPKCKASVALQG